jgi:hypothetical protein
LRAPEPSIEVLIQEQYVDPGLAQEPQRAVLDALLEERRHDGGRHAPRSRHPRDLPEGGLRAQVRIQPASGGGH